MTVFIANTANNNTFDYWRNRTNELAYVMSVYAVTANGSNAAAGNAAITGQFMANSLFINTTASVNTSLTIGNTTWTTNNYFYANTSYITVGNTTVNSSINSLAMEAYSFYAGANVVVNASMVWVGDVTTNTSLNKTRLNFSSSPSVNSVVNSTAIQFTNGAYLSSLTFDTLLIGNSVVGSDYITTSANFYANLSVVQTQTNVIVNSSILFVSNGATSNVAISANTITIGNVVVSTSLNSTALSAYSSVSVGSNVVANTSDLNIGNTTVYSRANSTTIAVGNNNINSTVISTNWNFIANSSGIVVPGEITGTINTPSISIKSGVSNTVNGTINSTAVTIANVNYTTTVNTAGLYTNGVLSVTGNTNLVGNTEIGQFGDGYVQVRNDLIVNGNLIVNGSMAYQGNTAASIIPDTSDLYNLGNSVSRFANLFVNSIYTSNNLHVSNNIFATNSITVGNSSGNVYITQNTFNVNGYLSVNSAGLYVSGTRVVNAWSYQSGANNIFNTSGFYTNGTVNAFTHSSGAGFTANSTLVNAAAVNVTNQVNTSTLYINTSMAVGTNVSINTTGIAVNGTVNSNTFTTGASYSVYSNGFVDANTINLASLVVIGNSSVNVIANSSSIKIANTTSSITIVSPTATQISQGNTYLAANGSWIQLPIPISNGSTNTSGTSAQEIDSYQMSIINGAEYTVYVRDQSTVSSNARYIAKVLTTHDRVTAYMTEYSSIYSNTTNQIGTFSVTTNTSHAILQFTPNSLIINTHVRYVRTIL